MCYSRLYLGIEINYLLSSVTSTVGKDGNGLKIEKVGSTL